MHVVSPLPIEIDAGAASPYLMRVVNRVDPTKPPPARLGPGHAVALLQVQIAYDPDSVVAPRPLRLEPPPRPRVNSGVELGARTAGPWLDDLLATIAPRVSALCSELAIRDRLVAQAGDRGYMELRDAALLTRHLGRTNELPELLAAAERAKEYMDEALRRNGADPIAHDRSTRYPQDWSHLRFLQFLESAPG